MRITCGILDSREARKRHMTKRTASRREQRQIPDIARWFLMVILVAVMTSCADNGITEDEVLGEWEKQGDSLPPIHLVLSKDRTRMLARLRLSGVDLSGNAILEGAQLRLILAGREPMIGQFVSMSTLKLRLGDRDFLLTKSVR